MAGYITEECSEECGFPVTCKVCNRLKAPIGRSTPLGSYLCDYGCVGYKDDQYPPHLWPGEFKELKAVMGEDE